ncbi:MAG: hypothetical protein HMLKMBBP_02571 [Planctomycetes bacterium]|jgi:hypothetical protein|nr:hypothetical protein [Planctomycetota bacterium]
MTLLTDARLRQIHDSFSRGHDWPNWEVRYADSLLRWRRASPRALASSAGQEALWYGDDQHDTGGVGSLCPSVRQQAFRDRVLTSTILSIRDLPRGGEASARARRAQDLFDAIVARVRERGHGRRGVKRKVPTARIIRLFARLAPWTAVCLYGPESRRVVVPLLVPRSRGQGELGRLVLAIDRVNRVLGSIRPTDHAGLARRSIFFWHLYELHRVRRPPRKSTRSSRKTPPTPPAGRRLSRIESDSDFARAYRYTLERQSVTARAEERRLVQRFTKWIWVERCEDYAPYCIPVPGDAGLILCDAYDERTCTLVEAKSGTSRAMVRMAVGQLFDYANSIRSYTSATPRLRLLVPRRLPPDLEAFVLAMGVGVFWRRARSFDERRPTASPSLGLRK